MKNIVLLLILMIFVACTKSANITKMPGKSSLNGSSNSTVATTRTCLSQPANSHSGTESTTDNGVTWGSCTGYLCNAGYTLLGNACLQTNQTQSCSITHGTGSKSSTDAGQTWGACTLVSCDTGYSASVNTCSINTYTLTVSKLAARAAIVDSSLAKINCDINCTSDSKSYDYSSLITLDITMQTGYAITGWTGCDSTSLSETRCTISAISANTTVAPIITCAASYTSVSGSCVLTNQSRSCLSQPSHSTGGTESSMDGGVTWGSCAGFTCSATYTASGNSCVLTNQTQSCSITHGTGIQSSTDGGATWGSCSVNSCDVGYMQSSNTCITSTYVYNTRISEGENLSCAINSQGNPYCWGWNNTYQVGNGTTVDSHIVSKVITASTAFAGKKAIAISTGRYHVCIIGDDNKGYCWGHGADGELGDGNWSDNGSIVAIDTSGVLSGKTLKQISSGYGFSCAIASDDKPYCWGNNSNGQLGDNSTTYRGSPVAVSIGSHTVKQIATGYQHTCAIIENDTVMCWGNNASGELGNATNTQSLVPVAIDNSGVLSGKHASFIAASKGEFTCIIASDNKPYCWGAGGTAELGNGGWSNSNVTVAVVASGAISGKTLLTIASGYRNTCVIDSNYQAYCWGQMRQEI